MMGFYMFGNYLVSENLPVLVIYAIYIKIIYKRSN